MTLGKRLASLEAAVVTANSRCHRIRRYENETREEAIAAYEAEHGPIGDDNVSMRVIISKPGERPPAAEELLQ